VTSIREGNKTECKGAIYISATANEEMGAFDQLGPFVRKMLKLSPLKISAYDVLRQLRVAGKDPLDEFTDRNTALNMIAHIRQLIANDRGIEHATVKSFELQARRKRAA